MPKKNPATLNDLDGDKEMLQTFLEGAIEDKTKSFGLPKKGPEMVLSVTVTGNDTYDLASALLRVLAQMSKLKESGSFSTKYTVAHWNMFGTISD